ncbi:RHS repeat-associated core domain-containing protein, partial [Vibrio sp. F74]|uniref:RHS repeat-associated core domain-containing protein n=1 Tax=Vibrio sp. F74 TaxID=700020 RepID=UPI0035F5DB04
MTHSKNWGEFEQHTAYDGRQEFAQWIKDKDEAFIPFRTLTLLPKTDEPYSSVLHQRLYDKHHRLTFAVGTAAADIENLYIHSDRLDSSVHVLDKTGRSAMRLAYSALGRTYRKYDDVMSYYYDLEPLANYEFAQLMPYRYTGKFTDYSTGLVQMDSRWYNGHNGRFIQPDNWNLRNTHLPKAVQHELMQFTGVNTQQLLNDPSQQMAYGYVRGNPLKYVDPYGLYLNPFNRDTTPDITLSSISNDLSTISNLAVTGGLAAGGPTNP